MDGGIGGGIQGAGRVLQAQHGVIAMYSTTIIIIIEGPATKSGLRNPPIKCFYRPILWS